MWVLDGALNFEHSDFAAVQLEDGSVLLVGGQVPGADGPEPSANAELFTLTVP